jgi:3-hydroxy-9,10-secoandrosta-1,3,5(10)-triene-9,17-dione monooxygenase
VNGGYQVSGRWPFSSGVDNCDWTMLAVTILLSVLSLRQGE